MKAFFFPEGKRQGSGVPEVMVRNIDGLVFKNLDVKSQQPLRFIGNPGHEIGRVILENVRSEITNGTDLCKLEGCIGLEFKNVVLNGKRMPDGPAVSTITR